ncbi:MAG: hypothetical protein M1839_003391 [Geoglossum umbratile]|nr:MAG: hypothetical protein M1839_003391 [Geoglossum umbratile]
MDTRNRTDTEWKTLIEIKTAEVEIVDYDIASGLLVDRPSDIARLIDHTALKPDCTAAQIDQFESYTAIAKGARELDMVLAIGLLKSGHYAAVYDDILAVSRACSSTSPHTVLKVIIETALLTPPEIVAACYIAAEAGAGFVKTCTGFSGGKATVENVRLMHKAVGYKGGKVLVKASAGVRDLETAMALCRAGAARIGTSAGVEILLETFKARDGSASS